MGVSKRKGGKDNLLGFLMLPVSVLILHLRSRRIGQRKHSSHVGAKQFQTRACDGNTKLSTSATRSCTDQKSDACNSLKDVSEVANGFSPDKLSWYREHIRELKGRHANELRVIKVGGRFRETKLENQPTAKQVKDLQDQVELLKCQMAEAILESKCEREARAAVSASVRAQLAGLAEHVHAGRMSNELLRCHLERMAGDLDVHARAAPAASSPSGGGGDATDRNKKLRWRTPLRNLTPPGLAAVPRGGGAGAFLSPGEAAAVDKEEVRTRSASVPRLPLERLTAGEVNVARAERLPEQRVNDKPIYKCQQTPRPRSSSVEVLRAASSDFSYAHITATVKNKRARGPPISRATRGHSDLPR